MKNITLYVVSHKDIEEPVRGRTYIGVGKNFPLKNIGIYDSQGENISSKNSSYCELTALYWIWKNDNSDYVGLEHYRRFFGKKHSVFRNHPLSPCDIDAILDKYDGIVSQNFKFKKSLYEYYKANHIISDLDACREAVENLYPDYVEDFDKVINGKRAVMCNMMVLSKQNTDLYCEWLFDILNYAEKNIVLEGRDTYQSRVFGFLSERLFNVWLNHQKLKLYHSPIEMVGSVPIIEKTKRFIKFFC